MTPLPELDYPEAARALVVLPGPPGPRFTPEYDARVLMYFAQLTPGSALEIGCNEGRTTRELAAAIAPRRVYGWDTPESGSFMVPEQKGEAPGPGCVGQLARDLTNVVIVERSSECLRWWLRNQCDDTIRFFFVDGDHSYAGVKRDTDAILDYLQKIPGLPEGGPRGRVLWHDCYDGAPDWCQVKSFLQQLAGDFQVMQIQETNLGLLEFW